MHWDEVVRFVVIGLRWKRFSWDPVGRAER
jgi:hypothetical protein